MDSPCDWLVVYRFSDDVEQFDAREWSVLERRTVRERNLLLFLV
jgi:hypothetical protein